MIQNITKQYLDQSRRIRLIAFTLFYFIQGIPIGLFGVALPAWMAARGVSAAQIATLVAITGIPRALKLIFGPFMDRFTFLPMGFRRPWVIFAQFGLALMLLSLCTVNDPLQQFSRMVVLIFAVNCFAALQDVAIDGMAIDLLSDDERGKATALMGFGQVAGISTYGSLSGYLLVEFGLPYTALFSAASVAAMAVFITSVRERQGERLLPWTTGGAAFQRNPHGASFDIIFKDLVRELTVPMSLLLISTACLSTMGLGVTQAVIPLIAVQQLGYSVDAFTNWIGATSAFAAFAGLFFGLLIDRHGFKNVLAVGLISSAAINVLFALAHSAWSSGIFVITMLTLASVVTQVVIICTTSGFMSVCGKTIAATQFAVYMSIANLAKSAGAGLYGSFSDQLTLADAVFLIAVFSACAVFVLLAFYQRAVRLR